MPLRVVETYPAGKGTEKLWSDDCISTVWLVLPETMKGVLQPEE